MMLKKEEVYFPFDSKTKQHNQYHTSATILYKQQLVKGSMCAKIRIS